MPSVDNTFGFTRQFSDTINQEMLDDERIEMQRRKAQEQNQADEPGENPEDMPEAK